MLEELTIISVEGTILGYSVAKRCHNLVQSADLNTLREQLVVSVLRRLFRDYGMKLFLVLHCSNLISELLLYKYFPLQQQGILEELRN